MSKWRPRNIHGQGPNTSRKERHFKEAIRESLRISRGGGAWRYPYWHIDLNAGCGRNADCDGSPLVFAAAAAAARRRYEALFIDNRPEAVEALTRRLAAAAMPEGSNCTVAWGDNAAFLPRVAAVIRAREVPRFAVGSCLADPCGWLDMPVDSLREFAAEFLRIDLIINLNVTHLKMALERRRAGIAGFQKYPQSIDCFLRSLRPWWAVSTISRGGAGRMQFITAIGRTTRTAERRFGDFYPLESAEGVGLVRDFKRPRTGLFAFMEGT